ncbi:MAG TPA: hypothetical protein VF549_11030 [Solirubrobacteraceae bacterium]
MRDTPRATRLEILGAWLHVWTPPRDVYIPPVPWRKVAIGAGVFVLLGVVAALTIAPAIDESKDRRASSEQRELEQRAAARLARLKAEERPRRGTFAVGEPRATTLQSVETAIGADAKQRFDASGAPARCTPVPGADTDAARLVYGCEAVVREIVAGGKQKGAKGAITIPYRAAIRWDRGRYAFCKINPVPGETAAPDPRSVHQLPRACRIKP